jgi:hypothetical protein
LQSHPQTIESTSNETSFDNLFQDINTVTRGLNPHAGPIGSSSEPSLQELTTSVPILIATSLNPTDAIETVEPLLPQLATKKIKREIILLILINNQMFLHLVLLKI